MFTCSITQVIACPTLIVDAQFLFSWNKHLDWWMTDLDDLHSILSGGMLCNKTNYITQKSKFVCAYGCSCTYSL